MFRIVIVLFFLSAFSQKCISQAQTFIDSLPYVCEMFVYNDDLYFTSTEVINDFTNIGRLFKVNLLSEEIVLDTILETSDVFSGLYIKDDLLYYTQRYELSVFSLSLDRISDIPDTIFSGIYYTADIEIVGSDLYVIASQDRNFTPDVLKYDLNDVNKDPIPYFEGLWPQRIYYHDSNLFITTYRNQSIKKLDISNVDAEVELFVDSLFGPSALIGIENSLYFVDDINQGSVKGRVMAVNLNDTDRNLTQIIEGFRGHHELAYHKDYLYITEVFGSKISRFKLPISTSLDHISKEEVSVYPNPALNILTIEGKVDVEYKIFSIEGKNISTGKIKSDSKIDVKRLPTGSYILYLEDGGIAKFQKM